MEFLNGIISIVGTCVAFGGGLFVVLGLVQLGTAIKDHQGPAIASALWQLAGAGLILAAGIYMGSLTWGSGGGEAAGKAGYIIQSLKAIC